METPIHKKIYNCFIANGSQYKLYMKSSLHIPFGINTNQKAYLLVESRSNDVYEHLPYYSVF